MDGPDLHLTHHPRTDIRIAEGIYITFIDIEKAFDTLRWSIIWVSMREIGVHVKLTNLIQVIYRNYSCRHMYMYMYT